MDENRASRGLGAILRPSVFGRLVAVEPTDKRLRGNILWRCRCDCGNEVEVATGQLLSGNTRSCGCLRGGPDGHSVSLDLAGRRFGRLVAVRPAGRKNGYVVWECQCDCGNTKLVTSRLLTSGKTRSCGCLRRKGVSVATDSPVAVGNKLAVEDTGSGVAAIAASNDKAAASTASGFAAGKAAAASHDAAARSPIRAGRRFGALAAVDCDNPAHSGVERIPASRSASEVERFPAYRSASDADAADAISGQAPGLRPAANADDAIWRCLCDCNNTAHVRASDLLSGAVRDCGCGAGGE